jgi:vitamin B12 transporter
MTKKVFGLTIFIATASTTTAQLADTSGKALLDEVIVTANKFPQKQSTTGKVISVISKEQIERSSGRTVPQLLNEQAGITINGALSNLGSNQTLYMRGASSGRALVLIDGMPVSDPTFINNDFDLNLLSLNSIERIEISRGAQSTLYGSDAVAGVVNIITVKKDITKPINVKAALAAGNLGTYRGNIQLYGKANKLTYNTSYAKLRSGGFSAAFDSSGNKGFDNDGYNSDVARASLQYQLNDNFSVRTFANTAGIRPILMPVCLKMKKITLQQIAFLPRVHLLITIETMLTSPEITSIVRIRETIIMTALINLLLPLSPTIIILVKASL